MVLSNLVGHCKRYDVIGAVPLFVQNVCFQKTLRAHSLYTRSTAVNTAMNFQKKKKYHDHIFDLVVYTVISEDHMIRVVGKFV